MSEISTLLAEQGRESAALRSANGQLWAHAIDKISQIPGNIYADRLKEQHQSLQDSLELARVQAETNRAAAEERRAAKETELQQGRDQLQRDEFNRKSASEDASRLNRADPAQIDLPTVPQWIQSKTGTYWTPDEGKVLLQHAQTAEGAKQILEFMSPVQKPVSDIRPFGYEQTGLFNNSSGDVLREPSTAPEKPEARSAFPFGNGGIMDPTGKVLREPRDPAAKSIDDPKLPFAVKDYAAQIRGRNATLENGITELSNAFPSLRNDHPTLDQKKAVDYLKDLYSGAAKPTSSEESAAAALNMTVEQYREFRKTGQKPGTPTTTSPTTATPNSITSKSGKVITVGGQAQLPDGRWVTVKTVDPATGKFTF